MGNHEHDRLTDAVRGIRGSVLLILQAVDDLSAAVDALEEVAPRRGAAVDVAKAVQDLRVDPRSFSVAWDGKSCCLGCTLAYRLLERLASRPDQYLSADRLMADIWSGRRARSTVRTAVYDLRRRLSDAGMSDLAARIDGRVQGHYGLMLSAG